MVYLITKAEKDIETGLYQVKELHDLGNGKIIRNSGKIQPQIILHRNTIEYGWLNARTSLECPVINYIFPTSFFGEPSANVILTDCKAVYKGQLLEFSIDPFETRNMIQCKYDFAKQHNWNIKSSR